MDKTIFNEHYIEAISMLRTIRKAKGFSQTDLAIAIGKPQSFISKVENFERRLDLIETFEVLTLLNSKLIEILPKKYQALVEK